MLVCGRLPRVINPRRHLQVEVLLLFADGVHLLPLLIHLPLKVLAELLSVVVCELSLALERHVVTRHVFSAVARSGQIGR